jgi:hypothetical protein
MPAPYRGNSRPNRPADQLILVERNTYKLHLVLQDIRAAEEHTDDLDWAENLYLPHAMLLPRYEYGLSTTDLRDTTSVREQCAFVRAGMTECRSEDVLHQVKFLHISDPLVPNVRSLQRPIWMDQY